MPSKFWVAEGKDLTIRYECHTEFISLTLIYPKKIELNKNKSPMLFDIKFLNILPLDFLKKGLTFSGIIRSFRHELNR